MIIVAGTLTFDSDDWTALEVAWEGVRGVTLTEEGCLDYDVHRDRHDPGRALLFERWTAHDLLLQHLASSHVAAFGRALRGLPRVSLDYTVYEAWPLS